MQSPLQLTFRSMQHSDTIAAHVTERAIKLERLFDRIVSCHVVVSLAGHHRRHGDRYHVGITMGLPGHEVVVSREPSDEHHEETFVATLDRAFDEAERQLTDWVHRQYGRGHESTRRESVPNL